MAKYISLMPNSTFGNTYGRSFVDAFRQMLAHHGLAARYAQASVRVAWRSLSIDAIRHTQAVYYHDNVVRVVLSHAVLRHSLQGMKGVLRKQLQDKTGLCIHDLIFC